MRSRRPVELGIEREYTMDTRIDECKNVESVARQNPRDASLS